MADTLSVDDLFAAAFSQQRDPRSEAYRAGVRAALAYRIEDESIECPYRLGTAHADAFFAGRDEGHAIWRRHTSALQQREMQSMMAAFDKMPIADQASIYGLIHDRAAANKCSAQHPAPSSRSGEQ